jgi:hypothetical protein
MTLLNPYALKYDTRPVKVFTSSQAPAGQPKLTMALQKLDAPSMYRVAKTSAEMVAKYIDGEDGYPPVLFPPTYDGERPEISEELFRDAATIFVMQAGEEKYEVEGLCHIAAALGPQWLELIAFVRAMNNDEAEDEKKAIPTEQSSTTDISSPSPSISLETIPN